MFIFLNIIGIPGEWKF